MRKGWGTKFLSIALMATLAQPGYAAGVQSKSRLMFMTSAYGVMLGALSGLATLAFYEHPSQKTRNVALGASLGLYSGILLGTYMIYVRPDPNAPPEPEASDEEARLDRSFRSESLPVLTANDYVLAPNFGASPDGRVPTLGFTLNF